MSYSTSLLPIVFLMGSSITVAQEVMDDGAIVSKAVAQQAVAQGEIIIPIGQQKAAANDLPRQGMRQQLVLERFGEPLKKTTATGNPPITRWYYEAFSVYFEAGYVLHSVSNFKRSDAMPTVIVEDN